jgi:hypothetical protein
VGLRCGIHSVSAADRCCKLCPNIEVEDERHVLAVCPAYEPLRQNPAFAELFRTLQQEGMRAFFNVHDQYTLARCLSQVLWLRMSLLSSL